MVIVNAPAANEGSKPSTPAKPSQPSKPAQRQVHISSGTGFVVSNNGLIVTNNHVIASTANSADHPYNYIVLQKKGNQVLMYQGVFVAQQPNADLAVIRCTGLKATPFQLLLPPPHETDEVYSAGFPGIADPGDTFGPFFAAILEKAVNSEASMQAGVDVTDLIKSNATWEGFIVPTVSNGKVEKITDVPGYTAGATGQIRVIEHSCNIRHGNSGGPLLNGGGQVLGVVGHSFVDKEAEDVESTAATSEVQKFLQANGITECTFTDKAWTPPVFDPKALIIGTAAAIALAIAGMTIALIRSGKRPREGVTYLLDELKKRGVSLRSSVLRSVPVPQPSTGNWQLVGRTPAGESLKLDITGGMFANSGDKLVLGRASNVCHLVVNDGAISRQHAHIRRTNSGFTVADRNSSNGTAVNGQFSRKPFVEMPLRVGDTITLGEVKLDFKQV